MRQVPDLLAFHIEPREAFAPLADIDPYACNLRLQAISAGDRDEIARIFRLVPDQVRITSIPLDALPRHHRPVRTIPSQTPDPHGYRSAVRIAAGSRQNRRFRRLHRCRGTCRNQCSASRRSPATGGYGAARRRHGAWRSATPGRCWRRSNRRSLRSPTCDQRRWPRTSTEPNAAAAGTTERPAERVLRVSEAKIEALVNLAGELVVAKNALAHSAKRVEQDLAGQEVARSIRRDHDAIDRLVVELHGTILQLRMVPVAQVFRSLPAAGSRCVAPARQERRAGDTR